MTSTVQQQYQKLKSALQSPPGEQFDALALEVFRYQAISNPVYARYLKLLNVDPLGITKLHQIPHLPIALFKSQTIQSGNWTPAFTFTSSTTTGMIPSKHHMRSLVWYQDIARKTFEAGFGPIAEYRILALLPGYLERKTSSLVYMVDHFMKCSNHEGNGFFLHEQEQLAQQLYQSQQQSIPTLLIGVTYALLDLASDFPQDLSKITIMETGGMKGKRKELVRTELHQILNAAFQTEKIYSEYGMTELMSQAYTNGGDTFTPGPWMRVWTRDITDPFARQKAGKSGGINIIDLGNLDTCSFIETGDAGRVFSDGTFTVLGRLDGTEARGCNLMVEWPM